MTRYPDFYIDMEHSSRPKVPLVALDWKSVREAIREAAKQPGAVIVFDSIPETPRSEILGYATTYDEHGGVVLADVPLTELPRRMESDDEYLVIKSEMQPDWSWRHIYRDRRSGTLHQMIVRPV